MSYAVNRLAVSLFAGILVFQPAPSWRLVDRLFRRAPLAIAELSLEQGHKLGNGNAFRAAHGVNGRVNAAAGLLARFFDTYSQGRNPMLLPRTRSIARTASNIADNI